MSNKYMFVFEIERQGGGGGGREKRERGAYSSASKLLYSAT